MSFTPHVVTGSSADGEYIYYNATVVNNKVQTDQRSLDPELVFQDTRITPILKDSSKYVVSVDGFTMNGPQKNFPLYIPQIQPGVFLRNPRTITATSGDGILQTYTTSFNHGVVPGTVVTVTGCTPTVGYNTPSAIVVTTPTPTTFTIAGTEVGASSTGQLYYASTTPDVDVTIYTITFGIYLQTLNTATPPTPTSTTSPRAGTLVQATVPIAWIPENYLRATAPQPTTAFPRQAETPYYYGYSYDHFVNILNNALSTAWRDVIYKATLEWGALAVPVGAPGTTCPFFEFNAQTGLFSLCQDAQTSYLPFGTVARTASQVYDRGAGISDALAPFTNFGPSTTANYRTGEFSYVGMNSNLEGLMTNFDTFYYGYEAFRATTSGFDFTESRSTALPPDSVPWNGPQTVYYPEFVFNTIPHPSSPESVFVLQAPYSDPTNAVTPVYIRDTQNYISTGSLWSPIASLVLVTNTLPVRFEANASALDLGTSSVGGTTQSSGASQKVLLETPFNCLTADMWRGFLDYKPLVPLFSSLDPVHDGIQNIDVRLMWRSRLTNSLIPVKMYNSSSFTLRLRFVRKSA